MNPQARGLGDEIPQRPHREAIKEKSSQGAKRYLTVSFLKAYLKHDMRCEPNRQRKPAHGARAFLGGRRMGARARMIPIKGSA